MTTLQLRFDSNLDYQLEAIQAVVDIFAGLPRREHAFQLGDEIIPNLPAGYLLDEALLRDNLTLVQQRLPKDVRRQPGMFSNLDVDEGDTLDPLSAASHRHPDFTVEMETGTGKTYVYLRTIHELFRQYGFRKFVVVVPSIAIYEGVVKTFAITRSHFAALYGNQTINLTRYDGSRLSTLRSYAASSFIEVLVITIDSFNKLSNRIFKPSEQLPGELLPYQYLQQARPILVLDEPQNMGSATAKKALRTLHPLFALRYSATHKESPNLVYQLTPFEAYRQRLVKRIQVDGVTAQDDLNRPLLVLEKVERNPFRATVRTLVDDHGRTRDDTIMLRQGDDLFAKTGREEHRHGWQVVNISVARDDTFVEFANGETLALANIYGTVRQDIFRVQIERTVERHLARQEELLERGVKVLSLFFIDRVANYVEEDGIIRRLFVEAYQKLAPRFPYFRSKPAHRVHDGYFAKRKRRGGDGEEAWDTTGNTVAEREAEKAAFELIMRDKERLLALDEDLCFIFAHSALKEGWDNPNVFQICTLNQTVSEMKKRQEIGRGLRIPVDQTGQRIFDEDVNILTVVANESYQRYVGALQGEYREEGHAAPPPPSDARSRHADAQRNDQRFSLEAFRGFWDHLTQRTQYQIDVDTELLVERCVERLNNHTFPQPRIVIDSGMFKQARHTLEVLAVRGGKAQIEYTTITSDDEEVISRKWYGPQDDLGALLEERALRGFRIREIDGQGGSVAFDNGITLLREEPVTYEVEAGQSIADRAVLVQGGRHPVFNLVQRAARETELTRSTINRILRGMSERKKAVLLENPEGFANDFIRIVRGELSRHVAQRLRFLVTDGRLPHELEEVFPPVQPHPQRELIPAGANGLYDQIQVDSAVERHFVEQRLRDNPRVVAYFKFPSKFRIDFPRIIGDYNPDWGILWVRDDGQQVISLVRETKGSEDIESLQWEHEKRKLWAAQRHFETLDIDYRPVTDRTVEWWLPTLQQDFLVQD
jgi:type III restriction enzyme